jgi:hypothetical protein
MAVNVPQTIWRDPSGLVEYGNDGPNNIIDTLGNFIVDPSSNFIVDTGITATLIPGTIWEEDDSQ